MKSIIFGIGVLTALTAFAGCATIMNGSDKGVSITSNPTSARIVIKNTSGSIVFDGKTPATVKLFKGSEYSVSLTMEGFHESTLSITKQGIEGWFWGNILFGPIGLAGMVIDIADGAAHDLGPDEISVIMVQSYLMNGKTGYFALLKTRDEKGGLRGITLPMVKNDFSGQ